MAGFGVSEAVQATTDYLNQDAIAEQRAQAQQKADSLNVFASQNSQVYGVVETDGTFSTDVIPGCNPNAEQNSFYLSSSTYECVAGLKSAFPDANITVQTKVNPGWFKWDELIVTMTKK